jgi:hypothetical protein
MELVRYQLRKEWSHGTHTHTHTCSCKLAFYEEGGMSPFIHTYIVSTLISLYHEIVNVQRERVSAHALVAGSTDSADR